jgi:predicted RNA-binding Zn ribbon-like protein
VEVCLMLRVTWEWLGQDPALDLANTVAVVNGVDRDLLAPAGAYDGWAAAEGAAAGLAPEDVAGLLEARPRVVRLREVIREALAAAAARRDLPVAAVAELNRASRAAPHWLELDPAVGRLRMCSRGRRADRLLARYARSALQLLAADTGEQLRVCPAPSCGMFYRPRRPQQRWCSPQCGTRARVARHYHRPRNPQRGAVRSVSG